MFTGSSPRMRGKRDVMGGCWVSAGLITAHAGKTIRMSWRRTSSEAHPRACGENSAAGRDLADHAGSSPRMRGKLGQVCGPGGHLRLIPAHAGKTPALRRCPRPDRAHPRACGENLHIEGVVDTPYGSSPRMRGKHRGIGDRAGEDGLIPAHAGKTVSLMRAAISKPAHPRACGENSKPAFIRVCRLGSSPRMRGKPVLIALRIGGFRLIPAHAGKTKQVTKRAQLLTAHPRACGENAERSGVLTLRSVRSWKTLSFPSSLKVTHCRAFVQLPFSRIRL